MNPDLTVILESSDSTYSGISSSLKPPSLGTKDIFTNLGLSVVFQ